MERAEVRDRIGTIGRLLSAEWSHPVVIDPITAREWGGLLKEAAEQLEHLADWASGVEEDNGQLRRDIDRLRLSAKSLEMQLVERRPAPQGVNNGA
jgi:hypothetical protein